VWCKHPIGSSRLKKGERIIKLLNSYGFRRSFYRNTCEIQARQRLWKYHAQVLESSCSAIVLEHELLGRWIQRQNGGFIRPVGWRWAINSVTLLWSWLNLFVKWLKTIRNTDIEWSRINWTLTMWCTKHNLWKYYEILK